MPPFRPFLHLASPCLRSSTPFRTKTATTLYLNLRPTRAYASNEPIRPGKHFYRILLIAVASGGILAYSASAGNVPLNLEEPAPPPDSPSTDAIASQQIESSTLPDPSTPRVVEDNTPVDLVQTGTTRIPFFPRTIRLPSTTPSPSTTATPILPYGTGPPPNQQGEEYQLLGLGIRTISFLRIQVYVVGLYVAKSSLPALQESLVRAFFTSSAAGDSTASAATTLVEDEKAVLKHSLLGQDSRGEKIWNEVLKSGGVKSVLRIVPTRPTDYGHMREGWVRSVDARAGPHPKSKSKDAVLPQHEREGFKESVTEFRAIFGGRQVIDVRKVLLLRRDQAGELGVWLERDEVSEIVVQAGPIELPEQLLQPEQRRMLEAEKERRRRMNWVGGMKDERISRLVWLGYLAGSSVASEGARESVVDGVMDIVERPIGTIGTQVL
ncbi:MAG: hypothetical protein Q9202_003108 [Teloschistes flavicans]